MFLLLGLNHWHEGLSASRKYSIFGFVFLCIVAYHSITNSVAKQHHGSLWPERTRGVTRATDSVPTLQRKAPKAFSIPYPWPQQSPPYDIGSAVWPYMTICSMTRLLKPYSLQYHSFGVTSHGKRCSFFFWTQRS